MARPFGLLDMETPAPAVLIRPPGCAFALVWRVFEAATLRDRAATITQPNVDVDQSCSATGRIEMPSPMKLYNHSLAPNPRRVRIFAAEKGIDLTLEEVDILAGQSRTPEFLAKNSSGAVPVLELDDGSHLSESVAICRYLEGLHPEPNLLGRDLREQVDIERWNRRMELELFTAIGRTVQNTSSIFQGRFKQFPEYGEA
jgi:hypothetical protein